MKFLSAPFRGIAAQMLESLRALLQNETFPQSYVHKFIGFHTESFLFDVKALESQFFHLNLVVESRTSHQGRYIAYTFTFEATHPDEILVLIEQTSKLRDLKIIL